MSNANPFILKTAPDSQSGLIFKYSDTPAKISILEPLMGKSGWLSVINLTLSSFETEDSIIVCGICNDGSFLEEGQCRRLFSLPAREFTIQRGDCGGIIEQFKLRSEKRKNEIIDSISLKNTHYFEAGLDKLDRWGEDRRNSLRLLLRELDEQIRELKKQSRLAPNLPEKLKHEKEKRQLENKRDEAWKEYDQAAREIELKKDELIDEIEKKLKQTVSEEELFTIRWKIV